MKAPIRCLPVVLFLLGSALTLPGCSEDVTAVIGGEGAFAIYGVLSPALEFQSIRVYPIEELLEPLPNAPLDAAVTSTDLHTGEVHVWQDSITVEPDGQYAHVFWAPFRGEYGHTYRIELERSDGVTSRVEAAVPPRVAVELSEPVVVGDVMQTIRVRGGAPRLLYITVEYLVRPVLWNPVDQCYELPFPTYLWHIPQVDRDTRIGEDWRVDVNMTLDYQHAVFDSVGAVLRKEHGYEGVETNIHVILLDMELTAIVASEDWEPAGGGFDPEVLVNLGTLTNVENGSGFVGAGYRISPNLLPEQRFFRRAGYRAAADVSTNLCLPPLE